MSYGYDANNDLVSCTDPEGKVWAYGYDAHRMTSLKNPLNITTAAMTYDSLARVKTQTVPRQGITNATYNFYFSGYRNVEEDPAEHTRTYYYDHKGREIAQANPLGHKTTKEFNGQNHLVRLTDPRSYSTTYLYDDNSQNAKKITNALTYATTNTYDSHFRLTDVLDAASHKVHFDYDAEHHLTGTVLYPESGAIPTGATYYPNGLQQTAADGRNTVTTFGYDEYGNPKTAQCSSHPALNYVYDQIGEMKSLTDQVQSKTEFNYDKRGILNGKIDPLLRATYYTYL